MGHIKNQRKKGEAQTSVRDGYANLEQQLHQCP